MPLKRDNVQLQVYCRAPAPSRDYCGLTITLNEIILNIWNVSHGPHVYPKRIKCILDELTFDKRLQCEIKRLFGDSVFDYALSVSRKEQNLQYLPTKLFLRILRYLAASDILRLSQTSKIFFELCNTEAVWKLIFKKNRPPNYADQRNAEEKGWREALKIKLNSMHKKKLKDIKEASLNNIKHINQRNVINNQTKNNLASCGNVKITNILNQSKRINENFV